MFAAELRGKARTRDVAPDPIGLRTRQNVGRADCDVQYRGKAGFRQAERLSCTSCPYRKFRANNAPRHTN